MFSTGDTISSTPNHPFFSEDKQGYLAVGDLSIGERVSLAGGNRAALLIAKWRRNKGPEKVYNLEVEYSHNFYVAREGVLVHNSCVVKKLIGEIQEAIIDADLRKGMINGKTFIPEDWDRVIIPNGGGTRYVNPSNPKHQIRIHPEGVNSTYPHNYGKPYYRIQIGEEIVNGQKKAIYTDINGNISNNYEATHIIVEELTITIN